MTFRELLAEIIPEALLLPEEFDDALMGYTDQDETKVAIYSAEKVVEALQQDGISLEDAYEYYEFNIAGAYMGRNTPLFLHAESS